MLIKALKNNFQIDNYELINYLSLDNNDSLSILSMRNHPLIKKQMNNSRIISFDEHIKFVHDLKFKNDGYWIVKKNNKIFGSIYLTNTNLKESSCLGGNFIDPNLIGTGQGIVINYLMHFLAFEKLAFKYIPVMILLVLLMGFHLANQEIYYDNPSSSKTLQIFNTLTTSTSKEEAAEIMKYSRFFGCGTVILFVTAIIAYSKKGNKIDRLF